MSALVADRVDVSDEPCPLTGTAERCGIRSPVAAPLTEAIQSMIVGLASGLSGPNHVS